VSEPVTFIGLGVMGKPMARHLVDAGYDVGVHNRSRAAVDELVAAGARALAGPAEGAAARFVITMLPDSPDVRSVADRLIPALGPGTTWIDMSTISPVLTRELAAEVHARGAAMLDAPVSGGDKGAREATLSIMVGGSQEAFDAARPVFDTLGKTIVRVGDSGAGQVVKACNQVVVGMAMQAMAEALVLGAAAGVDPEVIVDVLSGGLARCGALEVRGKRAAAGDFAPGFRARLHRKDLTIALETAAELDVPLAGTALVRDLFDAMVESGRGDLDHSGLADLLQERAGVRLGAPPSG
jgi:2-hydroxy-3-oxopropionate reductase